MSIKQWGFAQNQSISIRVISQGALVPLRIQESSTGRELRRLGFHTMRGSTLWAHMTLRPQLCMYKPPLTHGMKRITAPILTVAPARLCDFYHVKVIVPMTEHPLVAAKNVQTHFSRKQIKIIDIQFSQWKMESIWLFPRPTLMSSCRLCMANLNRGVSANFRDDTEPLNYVMNK